MAETVVQRFIETANRHPNTTAVRFKQGAQWSELTWNDYLTLVQQLAAGLQASGIRKGDRLAILAQTCVEWAALDLAILGLGAVTVPIYPSSTAEDIGFILHDSNAKALIADNAKALSRCQQQAHSRPTKSPSLHAPELLISIDAANHASSDAAKSKNFLTLDLIQSRGAEALKASPSLFELAVAEVHAVDIATLIYTSGTTGRPRGVVHSHTQLMSEVTEAFPLMGVNSNDTLLTFLPFAHVLGRIEIWGHAVIGYTMAFAESIERLRANLIEVKPTIMIAVPRIFEKIHASIQAQADISPLRRKAFDLALAVGRQVSICKQQKLPIPLDVALQYAIARKLVFDGIKEKLGGRLRFSVCGGAPLSREVAEFFHAAGILILEGYGLTETTAAVCVNTPFDYAFGTVGKPIGDVKVRIATDGEVLIKSKKVMREYLNDPSATNAVLIDGWFHSGDIGEFDDRGHLKITDRKKDLIKTAGGKYVAPQRLEGLVKLSPFVSNVHIHGDQRKYIVALITMAHDHLGRWLKEQGIVTATADELADHPKVKELYRRAIADANSHLASFESIKNFALLAADFTIESGELTPSLKVKRKVVDERYKTIIEALY